MEESLSHIIENDLKDLFSKIEFNFCHGSTSDKYSISQYQHEHLILQILLQGTQVQLLLGSKVSPREMWPLPIFLDAIDPMDEMRDLPPAAEQASLLLENWSRIFPMLSSEAFPSTREVILGQIRRRSEQMFNFSNLSKI